MKQNKLNIKWVYYIPKDEELEEGILYVSEMFEMSVHLCACGCGGKVVISHEVGTGWTLNNDGGLITIRPSVGNWKGESPHHAHYYITNNEIEWL